MTDTYDAVIIGTGVAGALIAWKLSGKKGPKSSCWTRVRNASRKRIATSS